ncbi:hypothetical protein HK101_008958 [Irineochytrium annulatum]|nr:hypothetical protein HK101_008958 [Irineochytrium annulatum]
MPPSGTDKNSNNKRRRLSEPLSSNLTNVLANDAAGVFAGPKPSAIRRAAPDMSMAGGSEAERSGKGGKRRRKSAGNHVEMTAKLPRLSEKLPHEKNAEAVVDATMEEIDVRPTLSEETVVNSWVNLDWRACKNADAETRGKTGEDPHERARAASKARAEERAKVEEKQMVEDMALDEERERVAAKEQADKKGPVDLEALSEQATARAAGKAEADEKARGREKKGAAETDKQAEASYDEDEDEDEEANKDEDEDEMAKWEDGSEKWRKRVGYTKATGKDDDEVKARAEEALALEKNKAPQAREAAPDDKIEIIQYQLGGNGVHLNDVEQEPAGSCAANKEPKLHRDLLKIGRAGDEDHPGENGVDLTGVEREPSGAHAGNTEPTLVRHLLRLSITPNASPVLPKTLDVVDNDAASLASETASETGRRLSRERRLLSRVSTIDCSRLDLITRVQDLQRRRDAHSAEISVLRSQHNEDLVRIQREIERLLEGHRKAGERLREREVKAGRAFDEEMRGILGEAGIGATEGEEDWREAEEDVRRRRDRRRIKKAQSGGCMGVLAIEAGKDDGGIGRGPQIGGGEGNDAEEEDVAMGESSDKEESEKDEDEEEEGEEDEDQLEDEAHEAEEEDDSDEEFDPEEEREFHAWVLDHIAREREKREEERNDSLRRSGDGVCEGERREKEQAVANMREPENAVVGKKRADSGVAGLNPDGTRPDSFYVYSSEDMKVIRKDHLFDETVANQSYRHVILPQPLYKMIPALYTGRLLSEAEWRRLGLQMSMGWEHWMIHKPEPNILLFRREKFFTEKYGQAPAPTAVQQIEQNNADEDEDEDEEDDDGDEEEMENDN